MGWLKGILDFLLPSRCVYCHSSVGDSPAPHFCSSCWNDFDILSGALCPSCGRPFESPEALNHSPSFLCSACRKTPPLFDQALSIGYFEGPLREAVHQLKYRPCRSLGKPLGEWMAGRLRPLSAIDCVMPVPLHRKRLRERGFNQALLLAHQVGTRHGIPLVYDNLQRIRPTRPQVELNGEDRVANVAGAFGLRRPELVRDRHVLLIDDVFTTGATMNECAAVLKKAEAGQVTACTLARAL
jgi:ComF family protein